MRLIAMPSATAAAVLMLAGASEPPSQAPTRQCVAWSNAVAEDEGGTAMTASVCSENGGTSGQLLVQCAAGKSHRPLPPGLRRRAAGDRARLRDRRRLSDGARTLDLHLVYEAMDGALTTSVPRSSPLIAMIEGGKSLTIDPAGDLLKPETFTLSASREALSVLKAACN